MREIKFRAWDIVENRFWYFTLQEILERRESYRGSFDETILKGKKTQFIGIYDKNKKEIYEGDIMRYSYDGEDKVDVIVFSSPMFTYSKCMRWSLSQDEIIGNIYENPDLLLEEM